MNANVDRVWFITGCSTGFGRALAEAVLAQGERVIATARKQEHVQEFEDRFPGRARALALDVTDAAQVRAVADTAIAHFGGVDVLVNNAGYGTLGAIEEIRADEAQAQFATNVFGALAVTQAFLPHMRERRRGHILNVSSVSGFVSRAGTGIYSASKFALEAISEALAQEVAPLGIQVTIVEPGAFRTDFAGRSLHMAETVIDDCTATAGGDAQRDPADQWPATWRSGARRRRDHRRRRRRSATAAPDPRQRRTWTHPHQTCRRQPRGRHVGNDIGRDRFCGSLTFDTFI